MPRLPRFAGPRLAGRFVGALWHGRRGI